MRSLEKCPLPIISKYQGKALIRNPNPDLREGSNSGLVIVLEFASLDHAKRFYESQGVYVSKTVREKGLLNGVDISGGHIEKKKGISRQFRSLITRIETSSG